jgi:hypothetical protein
MVINGQVLHNLVLDNGADAVLVGPKTAARLQLKPTMIRKNGIRIRVASGSTVFMDETIKPVAFVLNPGTRDKTTIWAKIVIVHGHLPNTLIGMSVMGPASIYPNSYKGTIKYYVNWLEPNARKAYLRCHMPVDLPTSGRPDARTARLSVAFGASTESARLLQIPTPQNAFDVDNARFRMHHFEEKLFQEMTGLYKLTKSKLEAAPPPPRHISVKAYQHLRPLDTSMVDLRGPLSKTGPGLVVLELFSSIMATTEALVRCGVKVRTVYACEIESKTREVAQRRLTTLSTIWPEQLSQEAIHGAHSHLPQNIRLITRRNIEQLGKPDLVVVGFPCQGFLMASDTPKGLRDPRTALFQEALRVLHLIWRIHGPCGYLFENLDAMDHPVAEVRREYCDVVQAVLGKGFVFDAVAVGSYAHRNWRWWTNLIPGSLLDEMVDRKFERRSPSQRVQDILEPGRRSKIAKHAQAPGRHVVNVPGKSLRALATLVSSAGSWAYRPGQQSMVVSTFGSCHETEPTALERERAMGFMEGTTAEPSNSITEADRRRILGGTMDMHALTFLVGSILVFQEAFFAD